MSRRRRRRTLPQFSQPLSSTSSAEELPNQHDDEEPKADFTIHYAQTDDDVIAMHRFLLVVAQPAMRCAVNIFKSLNEMIRVTNYEAALMVMQGDMLVGTMGIIRPTWWYGDADFLTDRWHFVLPQFLHEEPNRMLMDEAIKIAEISGLEFIHQGKIRFQKNGVGLMMPRAYNSDSATMQIAGSA
jgi:hypothetical protein